MELRRGAVWWCELPDAKRRPYVVLSRDAVIGVVNRVLAAPMTTKIRSIPTQVILGPDEGLPESCAVALDNIETVPKWALVEHILQLPFEKMAELCRAVRIAVDC